MGALDRTRRRRLRRPPRGRDERGGAISLWVVLMVPVSAFAAVVAMAGPQRLAAESSVQEAAEDLAVLAVAWRDGQQNFTGPLPAFPPDCASRTAQQQAELDSLRRDIDALDPADPPPLITAQDIGRIDGLLWRESTPGGPYVLLGQFWLPAPQALPQSKAQLSDQFEAAIRHLDEWDGACRVLFEALVRDLGYLGVNMNSLRGSYSDSLTMSGLSQWSCSITAHTTQANCISAGGTWAPVDSDYSLPCLTSAITSGSAMTVQDAVHVVLAADWQHAGWAAAQVWPDGIPMAAESTGRLTQRDPSAGVTIPGVTPPLECRRQLVVLDSQGRPVWAGLDPIPPARQLAQSVRRTTVSG